jgi:hypothetical protein
LKAALLRFFYVSREPFSTERGSALALLPKRMVPSRKHKKEFVMTQYVTDEQFGHYSRRIQDLGSRVLKGSVPFERTMDGLQALIEANQPRLVDAVGPIYPRGTIVLPLMIDRSLSLEQMIRRGRYGDEEWALREITEDRFPINRDMPELRYSTTALLIPPYRIGINFADQIKEMEINQIPQFGIVETLAIGEQYPDLQLAYYMIGLVSYCRDSDGNLGSPALWRAVVKRELNLAWHGPMDRLSDLYRYVAAPQAVA